MKRLSSDAFERALTFVNERGRSIDRALAAHHFGDAPSSAVREVLTEYQNDDRGFGHGLEPDFLLPDSSPMATSIALQILQELAVGTEEPLVGDALRYLVDARDSSLDAWPFTLPSVNDWPHAPWWHYDADQPPKASDIALNPGAEIVGYFVRWRAAAPPSTPVEAWLEQTAQEILSGEKVEPHQLLCCIRLAESPGLDAKTLSSITARIERGASGAVETDPAKWDDYCIKPLTAAPRPDSLLAPALSQAIELQIDYELERQSEDGSWAPHWNWYGNYPEDWERVQPAIAANITLTTLCALYAWDRLP